MPDRRVVLVSNRLPITVRVEHGQPIVAPSVGGLATALAGPHREGDGVWVGWPGDTSRLDRLERDALDSRLRAGRMEPVHLTQTEVQRYYDGFSNGVIWPLFHYLMDKVRLDADRDWEAYVAVNERFADAVARLARPGDLVWVHDYQLALVPAMVRERVPGALVGFFLHIPFPSVEVFRILPWRETLLRGLLGADLIGFHTALYRSHFAQSVAQLFGTPPDAERVMLHGHTTAFGVFPIGVDAEQIAKLASAPATVMEIERLRCDAGGRRIVLGVDRLDYTKGIPRRLLAFERFLETEPRWRNKVQLVQVAVPSREKVDGYGDLTRLVHEIVGRINGRFGGVSQLPVHLLHRSFHISELVALYRAADVMLVTPLRDGMNLVAKEFVAARADERGVLVLSELAGAAAELREALVVNPYDIGSTKGALRAALDMSAPETEQRMRALRARVASSHVGGWAATFLAALRGRGHAASASAPAEPRPIDPRELTQAAARASSLVVLVDYDGTLVDFAPLPELAAPDPEVRALLARLARRPRTTVRIVSGRDRRTLGAWLGDLPIELHAEHGLARQSAPGAAWVDRDPDAQAFKARVRPLIAAVTAEIAGCHLEEKATSLAWHYRLVEPGLAGLGLRLLHATLTPHLESLGLELLDGAKVLEVRRRGFGKGLVATDALRAAPAGTLIVALGDDQTDEELFAALPHPAVTVKVGPGATCARARVPDVAAARAALAALADAPVMLDPPAPEVRRAGSAASVGASA